MNYYDEEINLNPLTPNQMNNIKIEKLPRKINESDRSSTESFPQSEEKRQSSLYGINSIEVNELAHDMTAETTKLKDNPQVAMPESLQFPSVRRLSAHQTNVLSANESDNSDTDSDDMSIGQETHGANMLNITSDKLESLSIPQDVKAILPFILKYTPQNIDTPYHLQPFVPDYVPAIGDVDAFLKVTIPPLPQSQRQTEFNDHLSKLGLHYLDEPSGEQSEQSLLNMKLRSVLTGSSVNPRTISASLIPTKAPKDIDKWILEVEQVHQSSLSSYQAQPRKDMDALVLEWPRSYADANLAVSDAYQRCLREEISLLEYIKTLSQIFEIQGPCESQGDYLMNIQTLFALYLVAYQAWE